MQPVLTQLYKKYLIDDDCPSFIKAVSQHYLIGTIEKLTTARQIMTRRAAILAIGFLGDYDSNHVIGNLLTDRNTTVRTMAEHAIQHIWFRTGTESQQKELLVLERCNLANEFSKTIKRATRLIDVNPGIAEAWNQRSIAHFNQMNFTEAIRDCYETLERNPFHYPAAIGMGHCFLEINDTFNAIESFKRALDLNPGLSFIRAQINYLRKSLNG